MAQPQGKYSQFDVILPSQHFAPSRKLTPEQRLMAAVLDDVLDCLDKYGNATDAQGSRLFEEAKEWMLAKDAHWPYSFECICHALNLDPGAVIRARQVGGDSSGGKRTAAEQCPPPDPCLDESTARPGTTVVAGD